MDYEKKYKEAFERVKKLLSRCKNNRDRRTMVYRVEDIESIFPELKKNEDEKIKEDSIEWFDDFPDIIWRGHYREDVIAWLEKQGEQKQDVSIQINPSEYINNIGGNGCYLKNATQTSTCSKKEEKVDNQNCVKSADDIKPKFKIGDWIIDGYVCGQITSIEDDYPCYKIIDFMIGTNTSIPFTIQDKYHLWTIQDAKDGDVLQLGKVTAIFQKCIGNNCKCYCSVCDGEFEIPSQDGDDNIYGCYNATPATKEQHDLLFAKIKEAGYIFDFKNKELKKIEDEVEIPFGAKDSELQEAIYHIPKSFHAKIDNDKVVIKKGEKPTVLNEENERIRKRLITLVNEVYNNTNYITFLEHKELLAWLEKVDDNAEL